MTENQTGFERQTPDKDLVTQKEAAATRHPVVVDAIEKAVGPMEIMMQAVQRGAGKEELEILKGMFEFQQQMDAEAAKKAHFKAVANFKATAPPVKKDKWNDWLKCSYTSLGNLLDTYNPYLAAQGLSISFGPPEQTETKMTVECLLSHSMGHVASVKMTGPIDTAAVGKQSGKASRNPMQDLRSTFTYLRSTTCEAILGVSGTEATQDDDGNAANEEPKAITETQIADIETMVTDMVADKRLQDEKDFDVRLKRLFKVEKIDALTEKQANSLIKKLGAIK